MRQYLNPRIRARYLRFVPVTWHKWICMRVEVFGCDAGEFWNGSQFTPNLTILILLAKVYCLQSVYIFSYLKHPSFVLVYYEFIGFSTLAKYFFKVTVDLKVL